MKIGFKLIFFLLLVSFNTELMAQQHIGSTRRNYSYLMMQARRVSRIPDDIYTANYKFALTFTGSFSPDENKKAEIYDEFFGKLSLSGIHLIDDNNKEATAEKSILVIYKKKKGKDEICYKMEIRSYIGIPQSFDSYVLIKGSNCDEIIQNLKKKLNK